MKPFNLHVDIRYGAMQEKHTETDILNRFHPQKFLEDEVSYVDMTSFLEGSETWDYMQDMVLSLKRGIEHREMIDLVLYGEDLTENGHIKAILIVEGIYDIEEHTKEKIEWLYARGVHIASFCWNGENLLATGVKGSSERGLHPLGEEAPQTMIDCDMPVGVSRTDERAFRDIMAHLSVRVIATHSNMRTLCDHPRNLWNDQIIAIAKRGGVIGMNSTPAFVYKRPERRDIPHLVAHIHYTKQLAEVEALVLGLDYMNFYEDCEELYTKNLEGCSKNQRLVERMLTRNSNEEEVRLITDENALHELREVL